MEGLGIRTKREGHHRTCVVCLAFADGANSCHSALISSNMHLPARIVRYWQCGNSLQMYKKNA